MEVTWICQNTMLQKVDIFSEISLGKFLLDWIDWISLLRYTSIPGTSSLFLIVKKKKKKLYTYKGTQTNMSFQILYILV